MKGENGERLNEDAWEARFRFLSFLNVAKSSEVETKDEGNAPESMHAGRVFRGQVVPCSKNFCRGVDLPPSTGNGVPLDNDTFLLRGRILSKWQGERRGVVEEKKNGEPAFE